MKVLNEVLNVEEWKAEDVLNLSKYPKSHVKDHDILDALVAAITAYHVSLNPRQLQTLPANPPKDKFKRDLSKEMVYWIPQKA